MKLGILIGALSTAVIALAVAVVILATDDDSSQTGTTATVEETSTNGPAETTPATGDAGTQETCLFDFAGEEAKVDLRSSGLLCEQAKGVYEAFNRKDPFIGTPTRASGPWSCEEHPLATYPLLVHCAAPGRRFLVLGTAPSAHLDAPPEPVVPATQGASCGDLAQSGAGIYSVEATGVACNPARQMAFIWGEICVSEAPNPCHVIDGYACTANTVGSELTEVRCTKGRRSVSFEFGA